MKKLLLFLLFGTIALDLKADEKIVPVSKWQKVKTALTSKPAKIMYGILGITAGGLAWYIKKVESSFNELMGNGRGTAYFFYDYNLDRNHLKIVHTKFGDGYSVNVPEVSCEEMDKVERQLWKIARDGRLLSLVPFNDIKVNLVVENKKPIIVIRTYRSVCY